MGRRGNAGSRQTERRPTNRCLPISVESFSDHPDEGRPEHDAYDEGGQKASNCAERIVLGIMAGCRHSVASVPRKARENEGPALFYLVRRLWIGRRFHASMISPGNRVVLVNERDKLNQKRPTPACIERSIALVNNGVPLSTALSPCAESAHGQIPVRTRSSRSPRVHPTRPFESLDVKSP
jgi:hypothetical protein